MVRRKRRIILTRFRGSAESCAELMRMSTFVEVIDCGDDKWEDEMSEKLLLVAKVAFEVFLENGNCLPYG